MNLSRIVKVGLFHAFTLVTTLVLNKLLVLIWGKEEASSYFLLLTAVTVFSSVVFNPLNQWYARSISQNELNKIKPYILYNSICVIFVIIFFIISMLLGYENLVSMSVFIFSEMVKLFLNVRFNVFGRLTELVLYSASGFFVKVGVAFYIYSSNTNISVYMFVVVLAILQVSLTIFFVNFKEARNLQLLVDNDSNINKLCLAFIIPLSLSSLLALGREQIPRVMFKMLDNEIYISEFSVLIMVGSLVPISLQLLITTSFSPLFYKKFKGEPLNAILELRKISNGAFFLSLIFVFFIYFFSEEVIVLLSSESYINISFYLPVIVLAYAFYIRSNINSLVLFASGHTSGLLWTNSIISFLAVFIYPLTFNLWGFGGVVYSICLLNLLFSFVIEVKIREFGFI